MNIMICTDGSSGSVRAAEMVEKFKFPADTRYTVLGVIEAQEDLPGINQAIDMIDKVLGSKYQLGRIIRRGDPKEEIIAEALENPYDLVVAGGGAQSELLSPRLGSTTNMLARKLDTHFLVTRNIRDKITRILVCVSSEAPSGRTIELGGKWISNINATICLLHVLLKANEMGMNVTTFNNKPKEPGSAAGELSDPVLAQAYQVLREAGVNNEIVPMLRYGAVVDEVIKELSQGKYDLLVVGAHYQPGQDRWQETLLDDVTGQLLSRSTCSMLII